MLDEDGDAERIWHRVTVPPFLSSLSVSDCISNCLEIPSPGGKLSSTFLLNGGNKAVSCVFYPCTWDERAVSIGSESWLLNSRSGL